MDVTNPAMVGHSFGGATTLMALGKKSALKMYYVFTCKKTASTGYNGPENLKKSSQNNS